MKTAIVYDRINKWGGAEQVLMALHEIFPDAPLYTSVYDKVKAPWAHVFPKVNTSFLQNIPFMQDKHELLGWLTPIAFEQFNFDEYDLVISVTSEAAKGIITKPGTLHICYCLTPTRYLWSHYDEYFKGAFFKFITKPIVRYLRNWDKVASQRPDVMIAISGEVKKRIMKFYGEGVEVIYPPVEVEKFKVSKVPEGKYYLAVSRMVTYKRVDLALDTFAELGLPLLVVGTGSEEKKYREKYKNFNNIEFKGFVGDEELAELYSNAKALVFPGEEDFGIVMAEALASGTPVIAFKKGGALDIITNNETGVLFEIQEKASLISAVKKFEKMQFESKKLQKNAEKFSKENFIKEFEILIRKYIVSKAVAN